MMQIIFSLLVGLVWMILDADWYTGLEGEKANNSGTYVQALY